MGVKSRAHSETTLELEYGTLVPMRYMNSDQHFKTVSVAGWCMWHDLETSARFGLAVRKAIEERYDGTVAILASGSLSHHFANNGTAEQFMHKVWNPFLEQMDRKVIELWEAGDWKTFCEMLPLYNEKMLGRRRHARHRDAARRARLGSLRRQGRSRHAVFRQFGHWPDQCDLPRDAPARLST